MKAFPTVSALAEADQSQVLTLWSGLGYYRRARLLHQGARSLGTQPLPSTVSLLEGVPGIGRYTAGAIASIAYGQVAPLVDGNVARVIARLFAIERDVSKGAGREQVWTIAAALLAQPEAKSDPGAFNQSLMELGAVVCTPREPRCNECPVKGVCLGKKKGIQGRLPLLAAKAAPKAWARVALVATMGKRVLLARREANGLMGGLWEPPMVDAKVSPLADARRIARALGLRLARPELVGRTVHILSHRRMRVDVVRAESSGTPSGNLQAYDEVRLVSERQLEKLPMSTLSSKLLAQGASATR